MHAGSGFGARRRAARAKARSGHPLSILSLDDDDTDVLLLHEQLESVLGGDMHMECAHTLADGLNLLSSRHFDVALIDLDLPDAANREVERLRAQAPDVPLVIVTGKRDEQRILSLIRSGASDCLHKSEVTGSTLLRVINLSIERHRRWRDTERALSQQRSSETDLRTVIEASADAMLIVEPEGTIVFANYATESLFGQTIDELKAGPFGFPLVGGGWSEVMIPRSDGLTRVAELRATQIQWHGKPAFHVALHDTTDRCLRETQARRLMEESRALAEALQASNQQLEQYASVVAHDLRAPLRSIIGFSQLLAEQHAAQPLDADTREYLYLIESSARHLEQVVSGLLAMARIERDASLMDGVDCEAVLAGVLETLHCEILSRQGSVTHDPLPIVRGNRTQVALLFQNLIGNGLKFQRGSSPAVHISASRAGALWTFSVRDNGIGIRPEDQGRILQLFTRLNPEMEFEGSGIGLATCDRIVRAHGGRIWVESEPGRGATFFFTLQASDSAV